LHSNGGRILNDDGDYSQCLLGTDQSRQAIKYFADMLNVDKIFPSANEGAVFQNGFGSGRYAMFWTASGRWSNVIGLTFKVDVTQVSVQPQHEAAAGLQLAEQLRHDQGCQDPAGAWEFMKWLGNGDTPNSPQVIWVRDTFNNVPHIKANEKYMFQVQAIPVNVEAVKAAYKYHYRYPHCRPSSTP